MIVSSSNIKRDLKEKEKKMTVLIYGKSKRMFTIPCNGKVFDKRK